MSKPPARFLGVTMPAGEVDADINEVELQYGVSAGINLRISQIGMVPLYEEHAARLQYGHKLSDWNEMDYMEKALVVAMYRTSNSIKNQQSEAEIRAARSKQKKDNKDS